MLDHPSRVALPPRVVSASQSRVGYNSRDSDSSPHRPNPPPPRPPSVGPSSRSRARYEPSLAGTDADADADAAAAAAAARDRSESRDGRTPSRAPLLVPRRTPNHHGHGHGHGRDPLDGDVEKLSAFGRDDHSASKRPPSTVRKLARHFIGVRDHDSIKAPLVRPLRFLSQAHENYVLAFFGSFVAILGAAGISYAFKGVRGFQGDTPLAIGSLGATAVLLYVVPESPLSQPRNVIGGHMISALSGVIISQLFALNSRFSEPLTEDNTIVQPRSWYHLTPVAYALAVAIAVFGMQITKTVHPLIASAHRTVDGRYTYLVDIFLAVTWMTLWSFFVNNLGRRKYPAYWWTPNPTPAPPPPAQKKKKKDEDDHDDDVEEGGDYHDEGSRGTGRSDEKKLPSSSSSRPLSPPITMAAAAAAVAGTSSSTAPSPFSSYSSDDDPTSRRRPTTTTTKGLADLDEEEPPLGYRAGATLHDKDDGGGPGRGASTVPHDRRGRGPRRDEISSPRTTTATR
ncbi:hypothetical protein JCM11491_002678 [Sporobolomyces phaffii]